MKTLYIDCSMGAAGDMLSAALLSLLPERDELVAKINAAGIPGVQASLEDVSKCGIAAKHYDVKIFGHDEMDEEHHHHHHHHHGMHLEDIFAAVDAAGFPEKVRQDAKNVYQLLAQAESTVHGRPMDHIHFHEVGTLDAVADVLTVCLAVNTLKPDRICASPVHVGSGTVKCAHGVLPVPAPATAELLKGIPSYGGSIQAELCTPTGAALLRYFVTEFGPMPVMSTEAIGYGAGKKDFENANIVRAVIGESGEAQEEIIELACNLDDMTPEALGYAMNRLFDLGALDVYFTNISMKKCRPGVMLTCMCRKSQRSDMLSFIFANTTTLGVREYVCSRYALSRSSYLAETELGQVRVKRSEGYGVVREKAEFEDIKNISEQTGLSFHEVKKTVEKELK